MSPALEPLVKLLPYCLLWLMGMVVLSLLLGPVRHGVGRRVKRGQQSTVRSTGALLPLLLIVPFLAAGLWALNQIGLFQPGRLLPDLSAFSGLSPRISEIGNVSLPIIDRTVNWLPIVLAVLLFLVIVGAIRALINRLMDPFRRRRTD